MTRPCIICENSSNTPYWDGVVRCNACGFVFADANLTDAELLKLYRKSYFFGEEYSNYLADRSVLQKNFTLRLRELMKFVEPPRHKRLLEIGCAYGFFLLSAQNHFERVQGIDISEDGVRYCTEELGLNVIQSDLLEADFAEQEFDVVCLWDTIEHLSNPHLYIQKISRHMNSGALLAITTGDIESLNARLKKETWRLLHPPTHLQYFSRRTMELLLDRNQFEVVYNRYCGFYRSVDNISYNLFVLRSETPSLHQLVSKTGLGSLSLYLNLYDIMYVIARKR